MPLEDDFIAALDTLARAFDRYEAAVGPAPVLVGGAATAIYTDGAFPSDGFDVVAGLTDAFDASMLAEAFTAKIDPGIFMSAFSMLTIRASAFNKCPAACSTAWPTRTGLSDSASNRPIPQ